MNLKSLFEPKSVAVIGASSHPEKIGYRILQNIIVGGYKGDIYPVNPKGGKILGIDVYKSILDINREIDLGVIVIPARFVFDAVKDCTKIGTKFLVIISSGFSEVGNREEENKIVKFAKNHGIRILGPNIFGIYSANSSLNASFGPSEIFPGKIAIITQSGAIGGGMIGKSAVERIGLSAIVSVGNKADLDEADLLGYFKNDSRTKVILMYIEGVKDGHRFVEVLKDVSKKKHLVVIKSGRSKRGALAAASHTGSLAGSDNIFNGISEQCGILRAESIEEAFNWSRVLADSPTANGDNTVIITNGGGLGVLCADACEKYNVPLMDDSNLLHELFNDVMPEFGSTRNPIDLTGGANVKDYRLALEKALKSDDINAVLALYCETGLFDNKNMIDMIKEISKEYIRRKPLLFSMFGGEKVEYALQDLKRSGVQVFDDVYDTVSALGAIYKRRRYIIEHSNLRDVEVSIDKDEIRHILSKAKAENRALLLPDEARDIMRIIGVAAPDGYIARTLNQAVNIAENVSYPVVLKIVSEDIVHKTDAGGVALDVENKDELIDAYQAIMRRSKTRFPKARIRGVEVSKMVDKGIETIVGGTRDQSFGPVVMFGLGGIYVEILKDVQFRATPLSKLDAEKMVRSINAYPILLGVRGEKRKDMEGIVDVLLRIGSLIDKVDEIFDVEINPLMVYDRGEGVMAVDVRIILNRKEGN